MNKLVIASLLTGAAMFAQAAGTQPANPTDANKPAATTKAKKHHRKHKNAVTPSTNSTATEKPTAKK